MKTLLEILKEIKLAPKTGHHRGYGICHMLSKWLDRAEEKTGFTIEEVLLHRTKVVLQMNQLMRKWPGYSGDWLYPVPASRKGLSAEECYHYYSHKDAMWTGQYGQRRYELLDWMVMTLENEK